MSLHRTPRLNSARRRARKRTMAARDGSWCAYCWRLFADPHEATIDHVVPISLFRTWLVEHTVLACQPCNTRKDNRLPLLLALLLTAGSESADRERAGSGVHGSPGRVFTAPVVVLLARLAAACESGGWPVESADSDAVRSGDRSMPDLRDYLRHTRVAPRVAPVVNAAVNTGEHPARLVLTSTVRTPTPDACTPDTYAPADRAREAA